MATMRARISIANSHYNHKQINEDISLLLFDDYF